MLEDVNSFIQKIESMAEKIYLSMFEEFFESSSPASYAKMFINTKNPDKNKEYVTGITDRISNLKDIKRKERNRKKKQMLMRH